MTLRAAVLTIAATTLLGVALAAGSLTCSTQPLAFQVGCFLESNVATVGPVEVAVGVDASVDTRTEDVLAVAPYGVLAIYQEGWSAWLEVRLPQLIPGIPVLGDSQPVRLGFAINWP